MVIHVTVTVGDEIHMVTLSLLSREIISREIISG